MKMIKILLILQLAVLVLLTYKILLDDERLDEMPREAADSSSSISPQPAEEAAGIPRGDVALDEKQLRRIIRSELMAYTSSLAEAPIQSPAQEPEIDPVENAARLEVVKQELSYYIEMGEISGIEMQKLQMEISRLDPENRTMMLRELTRVIGSGELDGQL